MLQESGTGKKQKNNTDNMGFGETAHGLNLLSHKYLPETIRNMLRSAFFGIPSSEKCPNEENPLTHEMVLICTNVVKIYWCKTCGALVHKYLSITKVQTETDPEKMLITIKEQIPLNHKK